MFDIKLLVPIWGKEYFELFFKVNLNSLAEDILKLPKKYNVTLSVYCSKKNQRDFEKQIHKNYSFLNGKVNFTTFETFNIDNKILPSQKNGFKYEMISSIQKNFFESASINTILIFNYADFFWSTNSLKSCLSKIIDEKVSVIFSFCPPVKRSKVINFLSMSGLSNIVESNSDYICRNFEDFLHDEIWRRELSNKNISVMPSYLVWKKNKCEVFFHAYHQTIIAVKKNETFQSLGINYGTLDGYCAGEFFNEAKKKNKKIYFMNNFTKEFVVSLHPDKFSSESKNNKKLKNKLSSDSFSKMFRNAITKSQMEMALVEYKWCKPGKKNQIKRDDNYSTFRIVEINKKYGHLIPKDKQPNRKIINLADIKISYFKYLYKCLKIVFRRILFY